MFCVFLARHFFATIGNKQQPPEKIKIWCRWRMFHKMGRTGNPAGYRALLSLSRFTSDQELRHFFFLSCWLYESLGWRSSSVSHPSWWCGRKNLFIFIFSFFIQTLFVLGQMIWLFLHQLPLKNNTRNDDLLPGVFKVYLGCFKHNEPESRV